MVVKKAVMFDLFKTLVFLKKKDVNYLEVFEPISRWLCSKNIRITARHLHFLFNKKWTEAISKNIEYYPEIDIVNVFTEVISSINNYNKSLSIQEIKEVCYLYRKLTVESIKVYPNSISVLESLHKNVKLGLVSNGQRSFSLPEVQMLNLEKYFESIIFSSDVKVRKPNPIIFKKSLRDLRVRPENVVFIGDDLFEDIWGAKKIGLKTIWIKRENHRKLPEGIKALSPDRVVLGHSFRDIPKVVFSLLSD